MAHVDIMEKLINKAGINFSLMWFLVTKNKKIDYLQTQ
jgi:hypothetical protein